ncbi:MAG: F0F1 ATP synthase subunit A [Actinobacteria bacterium]|jgi:F-type H+-transporting ATPase subunit a|nr:F0F1 ATP synthase subunit A [Actinomycetota bacterium]MSZ06658.1 F0F1 ATP synthase subunit A [Actinomycetota bacterium]MSZ34386.1 F0F1 ATP synthase subunit A [Actinomycetota bacterium]MSZ64909.1 F0F1 ATP synthase subunit A [Actinomycetota bacterium]MUH44516.1 F0F1 ATP synthase subunit A [Actinomycetota bacterium]
MTTVFSTQLAIQVVEKLVPAAGEGRGFSFPPINTILRWKDVVPGINKVVIIAILSALIGTVLFLVASMKDARKAPKGARNLAEIIVEFIEKNIIMETMGKSGMGWTPFLLTMFVFIYLCNLPGIIPFIQMPATARMGIPAFMALLVWVVFNATGIKHQGLFGYFKNVLFPPGVPKALYILVTPIELISTLVVRPFSLAVRLFANMLAGHLLLVIFALLSQSLIQAETMRVFLIPIGVLPFGLLIFLTAFEILVAFLQAYIFTVLTAVYIGGATHPEH